LCKAQTTATSGSCRGHGPSPGLGASSFTFGYRSKRRKFLRTELVKTDWPWISLPKKRRRRCGGGGGRAVGFVRGSRTADGGGRGVVKVEGKRRVEVEQVVAVVAVGENLLRHPHPVAGLPRPVPLTGS